MFEDLLKGMESDDQITGMTRTKKKKHNRKSVTCPHIHVSYFVE